MVGVVAGQLLKVHRTGAGTDEGQTDLLAQLGVKVADLLGGELHLPA